MINKKINKTDLYTKFTENAEQFDTLMVEMLEENARFKKENDELRQWHELVKQCEQLFNCTDTADSAVSSNLPNLIRDILCQKDGANSI